MKSYLIYFIVIHYISCTSTEIEEMTYAPVTYELIGKGKLPDTTVYTTFNEVIRDMDQWDFIKNTFEGLKPNITLGWSMHEIDFELEDIIITILENNNQSTVDITSIFDTRYTRAVTIRNLYKEAESKTYLLSFEIVKVKKTHKEYIFYNRIT